jgi:hypothetical protein
LSSHKSDSKNSEPDPQYFQNNSNVVSTLNNSRTLRPRTVKKTDEVEKFFDDYIDFVYSISDFNLHGSSIVEPKSFTEAICDPNWKNAIISELQSLERNETWKVVQKPPPHVNIVQCRYVFKYKKNHQGGKFKARIVAKGYSQKIWS